MRKSFATIGTVLVSLVTVAATAVAGKPDRMPSPGGLEVFAAGQEIGTVLSFTYPGTGEAAWGYVVSPKGYVFKLFPEGGPDSYAGVLGGPPNNTVMYFSGTDCMGDAYLQNIGHWEHAQGLVFNTPPFTSSPVHYLPRGSESLSISAYSRVFIDNHEYRACTSYSTPGTAHYAYRLYPNEPTVTGVSNDLLERPVVIFGVP